MKMVAAAKVKKVQKDTNKTKNRLFFPKNNALIIDLSYMFLTYFVNQ